MASNEDTLNKVRNIIKTEREINKKNLIKKSGVHSKYLDDILDILSNKGLVIVAKTESFLGNKKVVQSVNIKWVGKGSKE